MKRGCVGRLSRFSQGEFEMRWELDGNSIIWNVREDRNLPHEDHVEMSGQRVSLIVTYGVENNGCLVLKRKLVWPMLRTIPNNTHASFSVDAEEEWLPAITIDGQPLSEFPSTIKFGGTLEFNSATDCGLCVSRRLFPCVDKPSACECITVANTTSKSVKLAVRDSNREIYGRGCNGVFIVNARITPHEERTLRPGETHSFQLQLSARLANEPFESVSAKEELNRRMARIAELQAPLDLHTGIAEIDAEYRMCKLRAGESIFATRGGFMHSPGGGSYYAATWCNDQIEYAGPWFAFTGDALALEASLNAYCHYIPFMGPDFHSIPSSVIAEGFDIWEGAGDRGDAAMYAYGATRFALASGRRDYAVKLWPAIQWTLEYCRRKLNKHGVVLSDADELEGRLPHGEANLNTSSLYYGGLTLGAVLAAELGDEAIARKYAMQAKDMAASIEMYFGHAIRGFKTYRYYDGCEVLRSWIGIPLCMGIVNRAEETVDAMFSPFLWNGEGMLSQEGETVTWDRSLLYGFRGAFATGQGEKVIDKFIEYSSKRLLGEHVPYPMEAWPEGGKRHLSAESALYCRIITEGIFGITPQGLEKFSAKPWIPDGCEEISLRNISAFGRKFDIVANPKGTEIIENN